MEKFKFMTRVLILMGTILLVSSLPAMTSDILKPKITIKPRVTGGTGYDGNFYKTSTNEREVLTYLFQPGIGCWMDWPKSRLLLNYTLEWHLYDDLHGKSSGEQSISDLNYVGHLAALTARHHPTDRLTLTLDGSYYLTRYPVYYDRLSDTIDKRKYHIIRVTPGVFLDFENRFSAGLRYRRTEIDYRDTDVGPYQGAEAGLVDDSTEHRFLCNVIYNPTRTTTLDLDYQVWWLDYYETPLEVWWADHGGEPSEYMSNHIKLQGEKRYKYVAFTGGVGWHHRHYRHSEKSDEDLFAYKFSITWQNPPPPEARRHLGAVFVRPRTHIYLAAERNFNNFGPTLRADRYVLDVGRVFLEKIDARLKGWYQTSDYEDRFIELTPSATDLKERTDYWFNVSAGITYRFSKRLGLSCAAGIEERHSNLEGYDYENPYLTLSLDFNYDLLSRGGYTQESLYY